MEIKRMDYNFSVCKVADYSLVKLDSEYSFIGKTDEEKSLVCITEDVPSRMAGWRFGFKEFWIFR